MSDIIAGTDISPKPDSLTAFNPFNGDIRKQLFYELPQSSEMNQELDVFDFSNLPWDHSDVPMPDLH